MNSLPLTDVEQRFVENLTEAISRSPSLLLPADFYDSFNFTQTGKNFTHPRTWGLIVKACWALPEVAAVEVDVRLNLGSGRKFQPDVAARNSAGDLILAIDYEGPNSSDARILSKDVKPYIGWAKELRRRGTQPPPYLIITTLPRRPPPGVWKLRWTAKGHYNYGRSKDWDEMARHPYDYWYGDYREKVGKLLEEEPWATVRFLNLDGARLEPVRL